MFNAKSTSRASVALSMALASLVAAMLLVSFSISQAAGGKPNYLAALSAAVASDAKSWNLNTLDPGGVTRIEMRGVSSTGRKVVRGYYTYNRGQPGWVDGEFNGPQLVCVLFHDVVDYGCRKVNTSVRAPTECYWHSSRDRLSPSGWICNGEWVGNP